MRNLRSIILFSSCTLMAALSGYNSLLAQISITQTNFQTALQQETPLTKYLSYDGEQIFELIGINGPNRVWDFTALEIVEESEGFYSVAGSAEGLPGADDDHIGGAEMVSISDFPIYSEESGDKAIFYEIHYTYFLFDGSSAIKIGGIRVEGDDVNEEREDDHYITWVDPGQAWLDFPVTYQKNWQSSYEMSFGHIFMPTEVDEEAEVDGWGTMITSGGSIDVLRIKRTQNSRLFGIFEGEVEEFEFFDQSGRLVASIIGYYPTFEEEFEELEATWNVFEASTPVSLVNSPELPSGIVLHQNYPNPFNPTTKINYHLTESTDILLTVHDLLGRKVATIAQGPAAPGEHNIVFDATSLSSGVYIYRLTTSYQSFTRKMTIVK